MVIFQFGKEALEKIRHIQAQLEHILQILGL
jgi:hypothetical protein